MRQNSGSPQAGKTSTTVINALVALAFIAFCAVIAVFYFRGSDKPTPVPPPAKHQTPVSAPAGGFVDITFYTSSAKKTWVDQMVQEFNSSGSLVGNKRIRVKAIHVTSGDSWDNLRTGEIKPDIWSPGDESWLQLAAAHWKNVKQRPLFEGYSPLLNVPLVIAVWEPMAKALGYPRPFGWKDIVKIAQNPRGWQALGHPEWGQFRWGHAHPDANSGFLSVMSLVYAGAGKTDGLTVADLKRPEVVSFLTDAEAAVEHYGLSNDWIDQLMHLRGPAYLSAAVQYENTIIETNEKHRNKPFKLVAVYPSEGAFWTQHPAAIIKEDWVTPEKEQAGKKFIDFLLSNKAQLAAMKLGLRPIAKDVPLAAPFDEEHGVMLQVPTDRMFKVPDESILKRIRDLWEDTKLPSTIGILLDRSGSMGTEPMDKAKDGAILFIKSMKPRDQLELTVFNHTGQVLMPLCSIKDCGEQATTRLKNVFSQGETALYDTILAAYTRLVQLQKTDPKRRYGLVVLTDGRDTHSKMKVYDFLDALPKGEDFDAPKIFTIAYGPDADQDLLRQISNRTNARLFSSSLKEITKTYQELSASF